MSSAKIQNELIEKTVFLNLKGQLNPYNALSFKKNVFNIPENKKFLVLDLTNLHSISGEGIKVFFESIKYFQKRNGIVILIHPKEEIFLLLKFLKLLNYVIIVEDYHKAKEVIESYLENKGYTTSFQIEEIPYSEVFQDQLEKNDSQEKSVLANNIHYYQNIKKNKDFPAEELNQLKENLQYVHNRLSQLSEKINQTNYQDNKDLFQYIEDKIAEIKKSNEFYFQEFQNRFYNLEESHNQLKDIVMELKNDVKEIKNAILKEPKNQQEETQLEESNEIKKINGYFIITCQSCGQALRIKQLGKHLCPKCKTEFNVLPKGVIKFYEHS
ncbi:MAG: hypothetical protein KatS3mg129_0530 [Leptospiraceae bacterium]|nr:MAG: hypothetical protein KatS3mg129_0530 [Leptospiraceae bacterium]